MLLLVFAARVLPETQIESQPTVVGLAAGRLSVGVVGERACRRIGKCGIVCLSRLAIVVTTGLFVATAATAANPRVEKLDEHVANAANRSRLAIQLLIGRSWQCCRLHRWSCWQVRRRSGRASGCVDCFCRASIRLFVPTGRRIGMT